MCVCLLVTVCVCVCAVKARERGSLSLADMEVVMNWKITKHTFRPLMGLVTLHYSHTLLYISYAASMAYEMV